MSRCGLICRKLGMSQVFSKSGEAIPITIIDVASNSVLFVSNNQEKNIIKIVAFDQKPQRISKTILGEFAIAKVPPGKIIKQFTVDNNNLLKVGDKLSASHFRIGQFVDITGNTIGKGCAGTMKRHNFRGLEASHGVSISHRSAGSTGQCQDPGRVFKGKKMAGRYGGAQNTVQSLKVIDVDTDLSLLAVCGSVPGKRGGYLVLRDAVKK